MIRYKIQLFTMYLVALVVLVGCAIKSATHPGAVNQFDSVSYDTLVTAQAALVQAESQFANSPSAVPYINKAVAAYNTAEAGWQLYHSTSGGSVSQATLTQEISDAVTAIAAIQKQFNPGVVK